MAKISDVIDAGTAAGAKSVQGVTFEVGDEQALRRDAIAEAVKNARGKADAVARQLGVRVGAPLSIREIGPEAPRRAYDYEWSGYPTPGLLKDTRTPISPGEKQTSQDVQVTFAIEQPD